MPVVVPAHMCRRSFFLECFSIPWWVWEMRIDGFHRFGNQELRYRFSDNWLQLATLMGHADPLTTRDIYLEPFTGLRVEYLIPMLDEDE
jgi:integrase